MTLVFDDCSYSLTKPDGYNCYHTYWYARPGTAATQSPDAPITTEDWRWGLGGSIQNLGPETYADVGIAFNVGGYAETWTTLGSQFRPGDEFGGGARYYQWPRAATMRIVAKLGAQWFIGYDSRSTTVVQGVPRCTNFSAPTSGFQPTIPDSSVDLPGIKDRKSPNVPDVGALSLGNAMLPRLQALPDFPLMRALGIVGAIKPVTPPPADRINTAFFRRDQT